MPAIVVPGDRDNAKGRKRERDRSQLALSPSCPFRLAHRNELKINATSWGESPAAPPAVAEPVEVDPAEMWAWMWTVLMMIAITQAPGEILGPRHCVYCV